MSSSTDQIPGTSQSDGGKLSAAATNSLPVTMNGPTNGQGILTNSNVNFSEQPNLTFGTHDPLTQYTNHQTLGGLGVAGYSAFPSAAGDGSWTPTFDPNIMGGFSFTPNVLTAPNQFFFPSTDVWGQDPLMMNSMNNSWLLSSVPMDQSQIMHNPNNIEGSITNTLEPASNIEQTFSSLSLNGAMLPTIGTVPLVDSTAPQGVPSIDNTSHSVITQPIVNPPPPQETKPKSWAAIASQPAKPKPPPPKPAPQPKEEVTRRPTGTSRSGQGRQMGQSSGGVSSGGSHGSMNGNGLKRGNGRSDGSPKKLDVVTKLKSENSYNPSELTMNMNNARYFVIKSYAEDDVHRSIKYNVWCSTEHGNRRLDSAFKEQKSRGGAVYLFFSVNGSGHFCGVAQMISEVDLINETGIWTQDKWKGKFDIRWIYVKDVPNNQLRHIRLENNENKPVTNSRDTQEVPIDKGKQVIRVIHAYNHTTSIFDDFEHYEKRQEEENPPPVVEVPTTTTAGSRKDRKS